MVKTEYKKYHVFYYENENGEFIDLSKKKRWPPFTKQSDIFFQTDSCTIRRDGTLPDNSTMFGGAMGEKQIGASLPANYFPPHKHN